MSLDSFLGSLCFVGPVGSPAWGSAFYIGQAPEKVLTHTAGPPEGSGTRGFQQKLS